MNARRTKHRARLGAMTQIRRGGGPRCSCVEQVIALAAFPSDAQYRQSKADIDTRNALHLMGLIAHQSARPRSRSSSSAKRSMSGPRADALHLGSRSRTGESLDAAHRELIGVRC